MVSADEIAGATRVPELEVEQNQASCWTSKRRNRYLLVAALVLVLLVLVGVLVFVFVALVPADAPSDTAPGQSPTDAPSNGPPAGQSPSDAPSLGTLGQSPSEVPSDSCQITLNGRCRNTDKTYNCNNLPLVDGGCKAQPSWIVFQYLGGGCDDDSSILCEDFNGGPPTTEGALSWIVAQEGAGGEIYFESTVKLGDEYFVPINPGSLTVDVNTYDAPPVQGGNLLQAVTFESSCPGNSRNGAFLFRRYGAQMLLAFENALQGVVTSPLNLTLTLTVIVAAEVGSGPVRISSLVSLINPFGVVNFTDNAYGLITDGPGEELEFEYNFTIDLTERREYTVWSTVVGQPSGVDEQILCSDTDFIKFLAGYGQ